MVVGAEIEVGHGIVRMDADRGALPPALVPAGRLACLQCRNQALGDGPARLVEPGQHRGQDCRPSQHVARDGDMDAGQIRPAHPTQAVPVCRA